MALFKKKKKQLSVPELKLQKLHKKPREQLVFLQKRFDHLQDENINLTTHLGELKLNADGEMKRIELLMADIKKEMITIKERMENIHNNMTFMISDLNLTARQSELDKFNQDLERIKPHNYLTITQFEKMLKDELLS